MILFALGTTFWGCNTLIYDDLADCPQGVYVRFYSMTPCAVDSTFLGKISDLEVFAFDANDVLVTSVSLQDVVLNPDYQVLLPVSDGNYSFIAWLGVDNHFTQPYFIPGVTTKKDIVFNLTSENKTARNLDDTRVWQGQSTTIFLPKPAESGSLFRHTAINLQEITNRVKVTVEFDASVENITPQDLEVSLSSANGVINLDGTMPLDNQVLNYPIQRTTYTRNSVSWDFSILDLAMGYHNTLKLTYPTTSQTIFNGDLIGSILLNTIGANINLSCENDFVVKFVIKDYCSSCQTHFTCMVYVNNWLVHSYTTELGF